MDLRQLDASVAKHDKFNQTLKDHILLILSWHAPQTCGFMKLEREVLGASDLTDYDGNPEYDSVDPEEWQLTDTGEFDLTDAALRAHLRTELHLAIEELHEEGKIKRNSENKFTTCQ
jgi:hypothetical protein